MTLGNKSKFRMKGNNHGGYRPNSGRPTTERKITLSVRISPEAHALLEGVKNKSELIDSLIKQNL